MDVEGLKQRLLAAFKQECHSRSEEALRTLECLPEDNHLSTVKDIHRELHSLKGAARSMGLANFESLFHRMESLLPRGGEFAQLPSSLTQLLHIFFSAIYHQSHNIQAMSILPLEEAIAEFETQHQLSAHTLATLDSHYPSPSTSTKESSSTLSEMNDDIRAQLNAVTDVIGELSSQWSSTFHTLRDFYQSLRVRVLQANFPLYLVNSYRNGGEHQLTANDTRRVIEFAAWAHQALEQSVHQLSLATKNVAMLELKQRQSFDDLAELTDDLCFVSCEVATHGLIAEFEKLCGELSKSAQLEILGASCKADKNVLVGLRSSIWHLITNALVHGIGSTETRNKQSKPAQGHIQLEFSQEAGSRLKVCVADDGSGMDFAALRQKAQGLGLVDLPNAGNDAAELSFAFLPGVSTASQTSTVAGRGFGLSSVLKTIESYGGNIEVESDANGTKFTMLVPVNSAAYQAVSFVCSENPFAVPAINVERCLRLQRQSLFSVENRWVSTLNDETVSVFLLSSLLGMTANSAEPDVYEGLVLSSHGVRFIVLVDRILGDASIRVHALGTDADRCRPYIGAAVGINKELTPVLSVGALLEAGLNLKSTHNIFDSEKSEVSVTKILLVDDSFTSRGLMQAILESANYHVEVASDGIEAWRLLQQQPFDVLVSDVEMPRLDGFTLTQRIRQDHRFRLLPVILVTALESDADKQRGLEAGANAYINKSSFEQETLLQTVRRFAP